MTDEEPKPQQPSEKKEQQPDIPDPDPKLVDRSQFPRRIEKRDKN